jgi:hypothetical protein
LGRQGLDINLTATCGCCCCWVQVAYNFIHSLGQHSHDADCNAFLRVSWCTHVSGSNAAGREERMMLVVCPPPLLPQVFSGEVDEGVRQEQQVLQSEVMKMLRMLDMSINLVTTGDGCGRGGISSALIAGCRNMGCAPLAHLRCCADRTCGC